MAVKNAAARALIGGVLYDLMMKTNVYQVRIDDNITLADKLQEVITSLNGKVTVAQLEEAVAQALTEAKASGAFDGPAGNDGTSVTVKSVNESTTDGGSNVVTFSDGKTVTIKNGSKGSKGDTGDPGPAYTLTSADKTAIAAAVKASLTTENWTFTLENGSTVTKAVLLG